MNRTANLRHPAHVSGPKMVGLAALGMLSLALSGIASYAVADEHGPDHPVERHVIPERAPAARDRGPTIQQRSPGVVGHGQQFRERGPVIQQRGPGVADHGPQFREPGPVVGEHVPRDQERGHGDHERGRVVFENHGPLEFRDHPEDKDRDFFDGRYDHGRYYPRRGQSFREIPEGYRPFYFRDQPYFFVGGVWYANGPGGYIVTTPPPGSVASMLPPFYTTISFGDVQYFYADDTYYQWDPTVSAYIVAAPPDQNTEPAPQPAQQNPADQLVIYPANGQSEAQQAQDRYECHGWAKNQTGFDPTQPSGGVPPNESADKRQQYRRAITACLTARGYTVE